LNGLGESVATEQPQSQQKTLDEELSMQQSANSQDDDLDTILNKTLTCDICSFSCTMWYDIKLHEYKTHINPNYIKINDTKTLDIIKCFLTEKQSDDKTIQLTNKLLIDTMCDAVATAGHMNNCFGQYEELMDYRINLLKSYDLKYDLYR
jgi:hypothetical protein